MTSELTTSWAMLVGLGAFHGINPGMGWLFAVALGMQERRRGAVIRALLALGAGHALAVAAAVSAALTIGTVVPIGWLRWAVAGVLVSLGAMRFARHRHPRWARMRRAPQAICQTGAHFIRIWWPSRRICPSGIFSQP